MTTTDLSALFGSLTRYHVATPAQPLPPTQAGVDWIWAQNGLFKRGADGERTLLIRVGDAPPAPGLTNLLPSATWAAWPGRLSGSLLLPILDHARRAADTSHVAARPIEQQYHLVLDAGRLRTYIPPQRATAGSVRYQQPAVGQVLADLHSHHGMPPFFSATDDADDTGLSVSIVIGHLFTQPAMLCRLNVWGQRQVVPALALFDTIAPFVDGAGGFHARD